MKNLGTIDIRSKHFFKNVVSCGVGLSPHLDPGKEVPIFSEITFKSSSQPPEPRDALR
jgi:hypothetical protein